MKIPAQQSSSAQQEALWRRPPVLPTFLVTGNEPPELFLNLAPVRGLAGVKEAEAEIPGVGTLRVAVCHGMANGRKVLDAVRDGKAPWHFVEFMNCPGGCIAGGGQPRTAVPPTDAVREQRLASSIGRTLL